MTQAHFLVAKTAKALAGTVYEELMAQDAVYAKWKADHPGKNAKALEKLWVDRAWPAMIASARATLADMLNGPLVETLKDQITDALIKDNVFQEARRIQWRNRNQELVRVLSARQTRVPLG